MMQLIFVHGLFNDTVSGSDYIASNDRMISWKRYERKRSWTNLRCYPSISLEGLRKIRKSLNQDSRSPGRDLSLRSPEYEAGVSTPRLRGMMMMVRVIIATTI
jgi:hypothetical protein